MRVSLIDPSMFTLPYDAALGRALAQAGCAVTLHGRAPLPGEAPPDGIATDHGFYRATETPLARRLPAALRLAAKGIDHGASMAGLARRLRATPPDILHFQWLPLPAIDLRLLPAFRRVAPIVLTVHDTNPFNGNPTARLQRLGTTAVLHAADHLIVHTEQGRQRLIGHGISPEKIAIIPHGSCGPESTPPDPMTGPLTLLLFGKLKPYKGADTLVRAYAVLPPELRAQARLRIVGKPYMDMAPLHALIDSLGIAAETSLETGFIAEADIPALFGPGTIAVFPYREIETSGVLHQAISFGRPIVATRLGAFAEILEDDTHGALVPPNDPPALAAALARLIADRDHAAAAAANVRALAHILPDWAQTATDTIALYTRVRAAA